MPRLPLDIELDVTMRRQPNETTCGPTCLHAIYDYYEDAVALEQVIAETPTIDNGGTYAAVPRLPRAEARLHRHDVHVGSHGVRPELVRASMRRRWSIA